MPGFGVSHGGSQTAPPHRENPGASRPSPRRRDLALRPRAAPRIAPARAGRGARQTASAPAASRPTRANAIAIPGSPPQHSRYVSCVELHTRSPRRCHSGPALAISINPCAPPMLIPATVELLTFAPPVPPPTPILVGIPRRPFRSTRTMPPSRRILRRTPRGPFLRRHFVQAHNHVRDPACYVPPE